MVIACIAVFGYAGTTMTIIRGNRASEDYTVAINLAQDKMEQVRSRARLANENECFTAAIDARGAPGGIFKRCWNVSDAGLAPNLKQLQVTVSWRDPEPRAVTLTTLLYQE
jgi:hypothetical protein